MRRKRKIASQNKPPKPIAWQAATTQFAAYLDGPAERSKLTWDHYRRDLDNFRSWWEVHREDHDLEPAAILASDILAWKDHLRTEVLCKGTDRQRQRKGITVNTMMSGLKSFLIWAHGAGIVADMPPWPKRVRREKPRYKAIGDKEQKKLLRAIESKRNKRDMAVVLVLLDGGPRVAELCALEWRDMQLSASMAEVSIRHGKGDKERTFGLSKRARLALLELRGKSKPPGDPVFVSRLGTAMTPRSIQHLLDRYATPLGMSLSPHMLRHTYAIDALARGTKLTAVQAVLGHQSVTTTLGYDRASPEDLRRAVERESEE